MEIIPQEFVVVAGDAVMTDSRRVALERLHPQTTLALA